MRHPTDPQEESEDSAPRSETIRAIRSPIELGVPVAVDPLLLRGDGGCLGAPLVRPMLLNDRWYIHGLLGSGGHAAVFCAFDRQMRRPVALKAHLHTTPEQESFLLTEAEIAAKFQHPSIATILDVGLDVVSGRGYIVQEFLQGATLREHLDAGNLPSLHVRLAWLVDLAEAIGYAHGCNVIHRDIKPENIFITRDGVLKLMDFGVALTPALQERVRNEITPAYSPPEVLTLAPRSTPASDIFNWGLVAFELLTGGHHACGVTASMPKGAVLSRLQSVVIPTRLRDLKSEVSPEIERLVMKTLRRNAAERPDAAALERRLKHLVYEDTASLSGSLVRRITHEGRGSGEPAAEVSSLPLWVHWRNLGKLASPRERLAYLVRAAMPSLRIALIVLLTISFYTWSHALFRERSAPEGRGIAAAATLAAMTSESAAGAGGVPGGEARQRLQGSTGGGVEAAITLYRGAETPGKIFATLDGSTYAVESSLELKLPPSRRREVTWRQVLPGYREEEVQTIEVREGQELTLAAPFQAPVRLHVATENPDEPGCLEVVDGKRRYVFSPLGSTIPIRPGRYRARYFPAYSCIGSAEMEVPLEAEAGQLVRVVRRDAYLEVNTSRTAMREAGSLAAVSR